MGLCPSLRGRLTRARSAHAFIAVCDSARDGGRQRTGWGATAHGTGAVSARDYK